MSNDILGPIRPLTPETAEIIRRFDEYAQKLVGCDLHTYITVVGPELHKVIRAHRMPAEKVLISEQGNLEAQDEKPLIGQINDIQKEMGLIRQAINELFPEGSYDELDEVGDIRTYQARDIVGIDPNDPDLTMEQKLDLYMRSNWK
jgi:hypothetical protein